MKPKELYKKAIDVWGKEAQILMAIEEMGELIHDLSRVLNGKKHKTESEIADVMIMLEQLLLIFDPKEVEKWKQKKLKRLEERLDEGEK